jgi:NAD(P)-dependent dehydrogenase (short-subunit alcohol dehydrogenase family)
MTQNQNDPKKDRPAAGAVLITGAARRLGREIALGMARAGWDVVVHFNNSASDAEKTVTDIEQIGRKAICIAADLNDPASVQAMFEQAQTALPLTALINNASVFAEDSPLNFDPAVLNHHVGPNLTGPLLLSTLLFNAMRKEQRGVIINLLDQKLNNLNPDFFSYTLTKQALLGATQMMAQSFAPRLRVVGVSPGLTLPSYLQDDARFAKAHKEAALLDQSSEPVDIVQTVVFLAGQKAITGVNLTVDGGQHLMGLNRDVSYLYHDDS